MKVKTSITLSESLLQAIDEAAGSTANRSAFLKQAAWSYLKQLRCAEQTARDIEIINRRADYLNEEAVPL
jgi:metal-responsive CopG/Arc/MetJ family transcriptional regulator